MIKHNNDILEGPVVMKQISVSHITISDNCISKLSEITVSQITISDNGISDNYLR